MCGLGCLVADEVPVPEDGPADASEAVVEAAEAAVGETDPVADVEAEITAESAVVSEDIVQASNHIARVIHLQGSMYRFDLERMLRGMSRRLSLDQLLDYAVSQRWVTVNGPRISPGETYPELPTSARYAVVGDGSY